MRYSFHKARFLCAISIFGLAIATDANATTLEPLVSAFALPTGATYTANDWSAINSIGAVKWSHKGLRETPSSSFVRLGNVKLDRLGNTSISFSGERTMVTRLDVGISEGDGQVFEKNEFAAVLKSQFGPSTAITPIRGGCKDEGGLSGSAVYEVRIQGRKSVFVLISTDSGGNAPNSANSSFQFSLEQEPRWKCASTKAPDQTQPTIAKNASITPPSPAPTSSSRLSVANAIPTIGGKMPRGEYAYPMNDGGFMVHTYYSDGAYIQRNFVKLRPQDKPALFSVLVGMCSSIGDQLNCRMTGAAELTSAIQKGRPDIGQEDFKAINTQISDLIKMDEDGAFITKRVRVLVNGQPNPQAVDNRWSPQKYVPTHNDKLDGLRHSIPARYFY